MLKSAGNIFLKYRDSPEEEYGNYLVDHQNHYESSFLFLCIETSYLVNFIQQMKKEMDIWIELIFQCVCVLFTRADDLGNNITFRNLLSFVSIFNSARLVEIFDGNLHYRQSKNYSYNQDVQHIFSEEHGRHDEKVAAHNYFCIGINQARHRG